MAQSITMKLELVPVPVTDIDRAKAFYADKMGFSVDHDVQPGPDFRVVQLTPLGSACSIVLMPNTGMEPGSLNGVHLVVQDLAEARKLLLERGVKVSDVTDMGGILYAYVSDPDGNNWALQQLPS